MAESSVGWKEIAVAGISILASVSTAALWAVRDSDLQRFQERCEAVSGRLDSIQGHDQRIEAKVDGALITIGTAVAKLDAHNIEAEAWKSEIRANRREISDLRTSTNARPDPYTGTNARERAAVVDEQFRSLDRRIDALEVETFGRANGNGKVKR